MDASGGPVQRSVMTSGAVLALLACSASVAIIALDVTTSGSRSHDITAVIAAALWVLGVLIVMPVGQVEKNPLAIVAVVSYAAAFAFPAVTGFTVAGHMAFYAGWAVVPVAWLANPAMVISLIFERSGRPNPAGAIALLGFGLALTTLGMRWNDSAPGAGFWLWAAAPGLLALGCVVESVRRDWRTVRGRSSS
jgi:hypothetical protein